MTKQYCIYSNKYVDEKLLNKEHIIPKNLGGHLDLSILVEKRLNSTLGSQIDAPFTEESFVKLHSKDFNFKGHSKKVTPTFKNSIIQETNEKVDISITNNKMTFHKKWEKNSPAWEKTLDECKAKSFTCNFNININVYERFFAKLFLGVGYYLYGQTFVNYGYHNDLREIMNSKDIEVRHDKQFKARILSEFENPDPFIHIVTSDFKAFKNYHVIWATYYANAVVLGVSLFGNKFLSATCMISDNPLVFSNSNSKGDVLLKELSPDSKRRLIKTTQEDVIVKFTKFFLPDFSIEELLKQKVKNRG